MFYRFLMLLEGSSELEQEFNNFGFVSELRWPKYLLSEACPSSGHVANHFVFFLCFNILFHVAKEFPSWRTIRNGTNKLITNPEETIHFFFGECNLVFKNGGDERADQNIKTLRILSEKKNFQTLVSFCISFCFKTGALTEFSAF